MTLGSPTRSAAWARLVPMLSVTEPLAEVAAVYFREMVTRRGLYYQKDTRSADIS